jgi:hypothetical protein
MKSLAPAPLHLDILPRDLFSIPDQIFSVVKPPALWARRVGELGFFEKIIL